MIVYNLAASESVNHLESTYSMDAKELTLNRARSSSVGPRLDWDPVRIHVTRFNMEGGNSRPAKYRQLSLFARVNFEGTSAINIRLFLGLF